MTSNQMFNKPQDMLLMQTLKVSSISHTIAHTPHGKLTYQLTYGEDDYVICLDAVPLDKETQEKVLNILTNE